MHSRRGILSALVVVALVGSLGIGVAAGEATAVQTADNTNITSAEPISDGTIDVDIPGNESLYYAVDLNAKEQITVSTEDANQAVSLTVVGPDRVEELRSASGNNGFGDTDASVTYTANQNATFYVAVATTNDASTTVPLTVETPDLADRFEPNDEFGSAASLGDGQTADLQLAGEEVDYYAVSLNDSDQITVSTENASQALRVRLFDSDQVTELRSASGNNGFGDADAGVTYTANADKTVYVEIDSTNDRSTGYSLSVQTPNLTDRFEPNDEFGSAAPLPDGQSADLQLAGEELDYYAISLNDSEQVTVTTEGASQALRLRLFGPNQVTELRSASGNNGFGDADAGVTYTANQNATFYLEIDSTNDRSTGYSLSVQTPNLTDRFEPNDGFETAASLDQGQYDNLDLAGEEVDYYAIALDNREQVTVTTEGASQALQVRLFDSDQVTELRSASGNNGFGDADAGVTYTANADKTVYVEIDSTNDRSTGYSLSVQQVNRTDEFEPNDEFNSAPLLTRGRYSDLDVAGAEQDYYFVPLNASQQVDVSLEDLGGELRATLYAANGTVLAQDSNVGFASGVSFSYTVASAGNYYVGITSPSNRSAGYQLVLNSDGTIERLPDVDRPLAVTLSETTVNASGSTDVTVTVTDARTGEVVEGATVSVPGAGISTTTNASGVAVVAPGTADTYTVEATAEGYTTTTASLAVEGGEHESGVSQQVFDAAAGADGTLSRADVVASVSGYIAGGAVDGVSLSRTDVITLVTYYISQ